MKSKRINKKTIALLSMILVVALITTGVTLALLIDSTLPVDNSFKPSEVTCDVLEEGWEDGNPVKRDVKIQNTGDTDAFIRAAIVVTWQKKDGDNKVQIAQEKPVLGTDYTLTLYDDDTSWFEKDGYYYYKGRVDANGGVTTELIEECTVLKNHSDGYRLSVEVIADAIQADGVSSSDETGGAGNAPVEIAWDVTVNDDGTISE